MKTLTGLDERLKYFENLPPEAEAKLPTYRGMVKISAGIVASKSPEDAIDLYHIGLKFSNEGDVILEDSEFKLLKDACIKNPGNWINQFYAQLLLKIKEWEK